MMNDPISIMNACRDTFSKTDRQIHESILANPKQVTYKSISRLAEDIGVSQPAVSRFIRTIGYSSYRQFRVDMTAMLAKGSRSENADDSLPSYFQTLDRQLEQAKNVLTVDAVDDLARYIRSFHRVFATGQGKSFQPAVLLEILMRNSPCSVEAVRMDHVSEICSYMDEQDLLILFSVSGKSEITRSITDPRGSVLLVTASGSSSSAKKADRILVLPYVTQDPEASPVSPVLFDILVELLARSIARMDS